MPKYIKKDAVTGAIRSFFGTPPDMNFPPDMIEIDATLAVFPWTKAQADSGRFYMPGDELIERPKLFEMEDITIPADGETKVTAELRKGTVVRFNGEVTTAGKKQPFEFSTSVAGEYLFEVEPPFPLQHQRLRIVAHEV
jgi:hypothetical protein